MVDPCGQRTTHADGARPSTSLASSQKSSRTGSRQCRGRRDPELCRRGRGGDRGKKEMGARNDGEKRKQHNTRRLPLRKRNNPHSSSSSNRSDAFAVTRVLHTVATVMVDSETLHDICHSNVDFLSLDVQVCFRQEQTNFFTSSEIVSTLPGPTYTPRTSLGRPFSSTSSVRRIRRLALVTPFRTLAAREHVRATHQRRVIPRSWTACVLQ